MKNDLILFYKLWSLLWTFDELVPSVPYLCYVNAFDIFLILALFRKAFKIIYPFLFIESIEFIYILLLYSFNQRFFAIILCNYLMSLILCFVFLSYITSWQKILLPHLCSVPPLTHLSSSLDLFFIFSFRKMADFPGLSTKYYISSYKTIMYIPSY